MKKINYILWYLSLCFFVFLAFFIFVKFIFIFFFKAAYEPEFMFNLTPYFGLSGDNNLQLLFLALIVVAFDAYLHVKVSKRNLMFSFLPTGIMLAGLGLKIATEEIIVSNSLHYLAFGFLLLIVLIDHKNFLMFPEIVPTTKREPVVAETVLGKPAITRVEPQAAQVSVVGKHLSLEGIDKLLTLHEETLSELRAMLKDDLHRAQTMMEKLEIKSRKIDHLAEEIEERRKDLVEKERLFRRRFISSLDKSIHVKPTRSDGGLTFDDKTEKETSKQSTMLDDFLGVAAVVKRGILKQVNRPFVDLLGYDTKTLLDKSLLDFIAPEGLSGIEGYYLHRLKGKTISTYETVLLTNNNKKIRVKITMKPMIFNGEKADMVLIRNLKYL